MGLRIIDEHLSNDLNYEFIGPQDAETALMEQRENLVRIYDSYKHTLPSKAERTYFERATKSSYLSATRIPQFYGTFKVHKGGDPKLRPIVSCVNSIPEIFSKWVDYWLKQAVREHLPTYLRDVDHL